MCSSVCFYDIIHTCTCLSCVLLLDYRTYMYILHAIQKSDLFFLWFKANTPLIIARLNQVRVRYVQSCQNCFKCFIPLAMILLRINIVCSKGDDSGCDFHVPLIPKTNLQSSHKSMNEHIIIYEQGVQLTSSVCCQKSILKALRSLVFLFSPVW